MGIPILLNFTLIFFGVDDQTVLGSVTESFRNTSSSVGRIIKNLPGTKGEIMRLPTMKVTVLWRIDGFLKV